MAKTKLAKIVKGADGGTEYCCLACSAQFAEKDKLELHLLLHNKEYRFLCGICGAGLKRKEHLDRHTQGHQEVRPHVCQDCGKGFKRKEHLNIHRSIHSGDKTQICTLCNRSFYRKDHLQKHLQTHSKLFIENFYPLTEQELINIKQEMSEDDDDGEEDDMDEEFFGDNASMEEQPIIDESNCEVMMRLDEDTKPEVLQPLKSDPERPFGCTICGKTYKRKDHLKLHSHVHTKKEVICSECGKAFHRKDQLLSHMNVHLQTRYISDEDDDMPLLQVKGIRIMPMENSEVASRINKETRPHECPICFRRFKRKQHLKVHSNVHSKLEMPSIWCSLCNQGFFTNEQFESHHCTASGHASVRSRNNGPQDAKKENNPLLEGELNNEINSYSDVLPMLIANEMAPGEHSLPIPQRVYVCKFCNKPFKRKDHYKIHLHIHTGVKSFFCQFCGKGFYRKDHLQKHATVHQKPIRTKVKKEMPELFPIKPSKMGVLPEITIIAPSSTKLRVPLQIKVPYQMVTSLDNGEQHAVTIDPQDSALTDETVS